MIRDGGLQIKVETRARSCKQTSCELTENEFGLYQIVSRNWIIVWSMNENTIGHRGHFITRIQSCESKRSGGVGDTLQERRPSWRWRKNGREIHITTNSPVYIVQHTPPHVRFSSRATPLRCLIWKTEREKPKIHSVELRTNIKCDLKVYSGHSLMNTWVTVLYSSFLYHKYYKCFPSDFWYKKFVRFARRQNTSPSSQSRIIRRLPTAT